MEYDITVNMNNIYIKQAVGGAYDEFWNCQKRYRIIKGGRGSKKSRTAALYFIYNLMKFYHVYNVKPCLLVVRRYLNTHRNSTRSELIWAINRLKANHLWHIPKSELTLTYIPSGQVILFRGLDDADSLTSISVPVGHLCFCWIEELFQVHNELDFNKLDMSFRGEVPPPLFKSIVGTMNPWNDLTWIKPRFFDNPDNNTWTNTTNYTQNEFLDAADRETFEVMKTQNPRRYRIEAMGEWGNSEGAIYADYVENPEKNHREYENEKILFISAGLDYGSGTHDSKLGKTVLSASIITEGFKKVYVIAESYFDGHFLPDRIVKWAVDFLVNLKVKYNTTVILEAEYASSSMLNNALIMALNETGIEGIEVRNAHKGLILDRIDLAQILLAEGRLLFTGKVPSVKKGFSTATWDQEKGRLKGAPIRRDDGTSDVDILDSVEYSLSWYSSYLLAAKADR